MYKMKPQKMRNVSLQNFQVELFQFATELDSFSVKCLIIVTYDLWYTWTLPGGFDVSVVYQVSLSTL